MEFTEAFRKVINTIDPVANSKIAPDNTPVKILADWSRHACDKLSKLTTDRDVLLAACEAIVKDGDEFKRLNRRSVCACKASIPEPCAYCKITAAIAQANKE